MGVTIGAPSISAQTSAKSQSSVGKVSGVVRDASGTPQLGASVALIPEGLGSNSYQFLTNTQGAFLGEKLAPGSYTVQVTLAGYLPYFEKHIHISPSLTTTVRVQLETMFASLEQLRRAPIAAASEPDDWKWVLRSAPGLRPVLQWNDTDPGDRNVAIVLQQDAPRPLGRVEVTDGARRPGSISNVADAPGTEFAYDQKIDGANHVVFAGQVTPDDDSPAGGIAAIWLPTGSSDTGPASTMVLREAKIGDTGLAFRGVRLDQSETLALGDRVLIRAGGEYVLVGVRTAASDLRPRVKVETRLTTDWYLDTIYAALPNGVVQGDELGSGIDAIDAPGELTDALNQLDAFPALLWHSSHPVLENGRHEEVAVERKLSDRSVLQIAAFHDDNSHVALFVKGSGLPIEDFFPDSFSKGFAYDGGSSSSWGGRAAIRERLSDDLEFTAVYAFSGAMVPVAEMEGALRDSLRTARSQSIAARVTGRVPQTGTHLSVGYKWINDQALSRVDPYGEAVYELSPYLHVGIRQPLPRILFGRWEAVAECDNLLAQGYVPLTTRDGQMVLLPAFRSFRGGLSLQF
jgi:hypothetical protein